MCITGGEPLLNWERTKRIIQQLRKVSNPTIYLYTAKYIDKMWDVWSWTDGIHFTLHYPLTMEDMEGFGKFQRDISRFNHHTFSPRLYIDQRITTPIVIYPNVWKRVEIKPWMKEGECPLPPNETLYIWKGKN